MIQHITNTKRLHDVYFEDIDALVSSKEECYLVNAFRFYYFSTPDAAKEKARKLGASEEIVT